MTPKPLDPDAPMLTVAADNSMRPSQPDRSILYLCLILLLGFGLRLAGLWWGQGYFYFGQGDGIEAYSVAVDYGQGQPRAQYIAQPNYNERSKMPGPLWTIFCYTGLRLWGSMEGVVFELILLNTATIFLIWLLARQTLGPPAAFWAALLVATLPSPVFYSVGVYNPEVLPFLGTLLFLALWQVMQRDGSRQAFWLGPLLLAMLQFHMSGLMLWPAVAVLLALTGKKLNLPWLLAGFAAGLLIYVPYLHGEFTHGWQNTLGMFNGKGGRTLDSLKAISIPFNLLVNLVPRWTRTFAQYRELGRACFGWFGLLLALNVVSIAVAAAQGFGAFQQIRTTFRGQWRSPRQMFQRSPGLVFHTTLLLLPMVCALVSGKPFHTRYALVFLPVVAILAACGTTQALQWPRIGKWFLAALVITTCVDVWFMPAFYCHQAQRIAQGDLFIPGFRKLETVYQSLKNHAGNRPIQIDDAAYLRSLAPQDNDHRDISLVRRYAIVREKETGSLASTNNPTTVYKLCRANEVTEGDAAVGFRGNGIALVAQP